MKGERFMKRTKLFISLLFLLTSGLVSCSQNKIVTSSQSSSSSFSSEKFNSTSSSFIPKEKINAVIENMKSNFSFEFEDASSYFRFYIQQNIIHFFSSLEDEKGSYIELTNETAYLYVYKKDNNWYKSDILLLDYTSIVKEKISKAKWEDIKVSNEEWPKMKSSSQCEYGQLPVLEYNGKTYSQSHAIELYLGKKFNLYGSSIDDEYQINSLLDSFDDLFIVFHAYAAPTNEEDKKNKEQIKQEFLMKLGFFTEVYDKHYEKNGYKKYYLGDTFTIADLFLCCLLLRQLIF